MRYVLLLAVAIGCAGSVRAQTFAGTATVADSVRVDVLQSIISPTDSIDRSDYELKLYDIPDVEEIAETYRANGMKWFYPRHTPEMFYPMLDSNLIPIREYPFGKHRNPVLTSQAALAFYNAYVESESSEHLRGFMNNVDWLLENSDGFYLRYAFAWSHAGHRLAEGWVSAMAQGEALAAISSAYFLTGDRKYLDAANGVFQTMYRNTDDTWVFLVDERAYYWLEEYPNRDLCHVLNGILFGLWGLWDYYVITDDVFALDLFRAGLRAVADHFEIWNVQSKNLSRYCLHGLTYDYYHDTHVRQLEAYLHHFDIPEFEQAVTAFTSYASIALSAAAIDFGSVAAGEEVQRSVTLYSDGSGPVEIGGLSTGTPEYHVSDWKGDVASGGSLVIPVTFVGEVPGTYTDKLRVENNVRPVSIDLTAEVEAASDVAVEEVRERPDAFALEQNYPNPFRSYTVIRYSLPQPSHVRVALFNALGQEIGVLVDDVKGAGEHAEVLRLPGSTSGVYFCRIETEGVAKTLRMIRISDAP